LQNAERELIRQGYDPSDVDDALRRYTAGRDVLNLNQQLIVTAALRFAGPLPQPLPPAEHGPFHIAPHPAVPPPPPPAPLATPPQHPVALMAAPPPPPPVPPPPPPGPPPAWATVGVNQSPPPPPWNNIPPGYLDDFANSDKPLWW
jgi:hypothetical protein